MYEHFKIGFIQWKWLTLGSFANNDQPYFNIVNGFVHKLDQKLHLWKFPLTGPEIILLSIYGVY